MKCLERRLWEQAGRTKKGLGRVGRRRALHPGPDHEPPAQHRPALHRRRNNLNLEGQPVHFEMTASVQIVVM